MAYAYYNNGNNNNNHDQTGVIFAPNQQQFTHFRVVNPHFPLSGPTSINPFFVINPSFAPPVPVPVVPQLVILNPPVAFPVALAVNPAVLARMEIERSVSLLKYIADQGLVPFPEEELARKNVIDKLKQIVMQWVKRVAFQRRLRRDYIRAASAAVLPYGSYGLGVHNSESDIDALCVGPYFATMKEDFFIVLRNILSSRPEVSDIHCVKDAKVPLMRFKFDGISVDLSYAQLAVSSVPENVDILNPFFLRDIDETSWKSLSGVRANESILQLVPNVEIFQSLLRCIKFWAKRRGVYGNLLGLFGGVHLAVLTAFICLRNPNVSFSALISVFFKTFAFWPWPAPVLLQHEMMPQPVHAEKQPWMPIQLPCSPYEYCHSNITRSTFLKIRAEFLRGHKMTKDLLQPDFDWGSLFEPFAYSKRYSRFVRIGLLASNRDELVDWVGWVKSRFRSLLVKLEEVQGTCDPNPTEYVDADETEPNVVFHWGLQPGRSDFVDISSVEKDFVKNITNGYQGPSGKIALSIVPASQLPKNTEFNTGSTKVTKACWRIPDYSGQGIPVYSKHLPNYLVGFLETNPNTEYASAGV